MPQNLIWLVKCRPTDTGSRDPSARPAPAPHRRRSRHTASQAPWRSAEGRRSGRLACTHASRRTRRSNARMAVNIQPQPSSSVNSRTPSVPHMRLAAWVMISPTWGFPITAAAAMGREQVVRSRITRSTRLLETRMPRQTRSRAQTLRCPSPSQGDASRSASMATSRASSEIEGFGPRRFAGGRSAVACCRLISWRRTRNGQNPRPHRPAGGRRNPCRNERWRHSSPRPPPPQRAGRLRLGLQQFHLHDQLPDPLQCPVPPSPDRPCVP